MFLKATKKFIKENKRPIPFSLNWELEKKIGDLIMIFHKISFDIGNGIEIVGKKELIFLEKKFTNIYNVLKHKSNDFSDEGKLVDILIKSVDRLYSISSWLDKVAYYPDKKDEEKKILKKNRKLFKYLKKIPGLHFADLKIICIANEYSKKNKKKISFVTRDKGILDNKKVLEKEFKFILIRRVRDYVS
ncbi:hypothetical protein KAJ87_02185 [Candidatus Pacearchaeota archaeon]|nr:hypothetical protein [Candidatus Pacearchaeota archaeon]